MLGQGGVRRADDLPAGAGEQETQIVGQGSEPCTPPSLTTSTIPHLRSLHHPLPMRSTRGPDRQGRRRHRQRPGPRPRLRHANSPAAAPPSSSTTSTRPSPRQAVAAITAAGGTAVAEVVAGRHAARPPQPLVDRAVEEFGRLDVLVTNAGILRDKVLWKMTDDDFDAVITTHLRGTFTCARAAAVRHARAGRGRPRSSWSAPRPASAATSGRPTTPPPRPASSAWPAPGRWSWPAPSITVNAIVPVAATAMTETIPFLRALHRGAEGRRAAARRSPRKGEGFGTPEDCRRRWSPSSPPTPPRGITGQAIGIGGDRLALWSHPQEIAVAYADGRLVAPTPSPTSWPAAARPAPQQSVRPAVPGGAPNDACSMDLDNLVAIDVHTHVARRHPRATWSLDDELHDGRREVLQGRRRANPTVPDIAARLPRAGTWPPSSSRVDAESATGHPRPSRTRRSPTPPPSTPTC